jgi:hypothetical protein
MRRYVALKFRDAMRRTTQSMERVLMPQRRAQEVEDSRKLFVHCGVWVQTQRELRADAARAAKFAAATKAAAHESAKHQGGHRNKVTVGAPPAAWGADDELLLASELRKEFAQLQFPEIQDVSG